MQTTDELLTELERLGAQAFELAEAGDTVQAATVVALRAKAVERLQLLKGPLSYTDWNRLVVIHCQGNRIAASLQAARVRIASEFLDSMREHALLECMSGVLESEAPVLQLNERG
jgi:hypothetical protein